jgi:hypothetical protein
MAGLLENDKTQAPDGPPAEATAPAPDVVIEPAAPVAEPGLRSCASCASPLADGQDWCLECGTAQPGRLGARAGWRAAGTVVAACVLLATGAGAAAYAALSSESQRVASAPAPPAAAPVVAQPPAVPAPPPEIETPSVAAPGSEPADLPAVKAPDPVDDPVDTPSASSGSSSAGAGSTAGDDADTGGAGSGSDAAAEEQPIDLSADAASTYDPFDRGKGAVGDPADAVDGKDATAWEAPVGGDGLVRIGLAVSLEQARTLSRIAFKADTPGFTVEVYGTRASTLPSTITSKRWENLGVTKDVGINTDFDVNGRFRHVVVWVTAQPADTKVAIPEIQLYD